MAEIVIVMKAFRYEPIVDASIRSVLGQTYKDFRLYVWVSEKTEDFVKKYAQKDNRIRVVSRNEWDEKKGSFHHYKELLTIERANFLCTIDADDLFKGNFLEEMKTYMEEHQLDITFCNYSLLAGTKVYNSNYNPESVVMKKSELAEKLPDIYKNMRTVWATMISAQAIMQTDFSYLSEDLDKRAYGGDTQVILTIVRACNRIGRLGKELYIYNSAQGASKVYAKSRLYADSYMYNFAMNFLKDMNILTQKNVYFLVRVLYNAVWDTVNVIEASNRDCSEKIEDILIMFQQAEIRNALILWREDFLAETLDRDIFSEIYKIVAQANDFSEKDKKNLVAIFQYICPEFAGEKWQKCLSKIILQRELLDGILKKNNRQLQFLDTYKNKEEFFDDAGEVFSLILMNDAPNVYDEIVKNLEKQNEFYDDYVALYKHYSAFIEDTEGFVKAWLLQCERLIQCSEVNKAKLELNQIKELGIDSEWLDELVEMVQ